MSREVFEGIYLSLALAEDLEQAVKDMTSRGLRELAGSLARQGCASGVPSLIHGLLLHEAAERFLKMKGKDLP